MRVILPCVIGALGAAAQANPVAVSGSFRSEIDRQKSLAFGNASNRYVVPTPAQFGAFQSMAGQLWSGGFLTDPSASASIATQANALGYEFVRFTDTDTGQTYHGFREVLAGGQQSLGWGNYWMNTSALTNLMVQVPHTLFDINTEDLGARAFAQSSARGMLMAGSHRNANGFGTADVARLTNSIFHAVHVAWNGPSAQTAGWQIHGFDLDGTDFPSDAAVVLSNGAGAVTSEIRELNARFDAIPGYRCYCYNTLSPGHALNIEVNDGVDGRVFDNLAATGNVQGQHSRGLGGQFTHLEFDQPLRFTTDPRILTSQVVSDAMRTIAPITTTSIKRWDGGASGTSTSWTVNSASSWSSDGLPTAADAVVFDTTLVASLPAQMTLTATRMTIKQLVWNADSSSRLVSATTGSTHSIITLQGDRPQSTVPLIEMGSAAGDAELLIDDANTSSGSGRVQISLGASGPILVRNAASRLHLACRVIENAPGRRITKTGAGTLILSNVGNSFTGGVVVREGTLAVPTFEALGLVPGEVRSDFIRFEGGRLRYTGVTAAVDARRGVFVSGSGMIEVDSASARLGYAGVIGGSGTFTKAGAGTLVLSGAGDFAGTLLVSQGVLEVAGDSALGTTAGVTSVNPGAAIAFGAGLNYTMNEQVFVAGVGPDGLGAVRGTSGVARFAGRINITDDTTIAVPTGSLELAGGVLGVAPLSVVGGGELITSRIRVGGLAAGAARITLNGGRSDALASRVTSLVMGSGVLDLGVNDFTIDYTGDSPASQVQARVASAFAGGAWTDEGITSGLAEGTELMIGLADTSHASIGTFGGQTVDGTAVLLRLTVGGDANLDGTVDLFDYFQMATWYGQDLGGEAVWSQGDFNYDGRVDASDFDRLVANFGLTVDLGTMSTWRDVSMPAPTSIPEPGVLGVLAAMVVWSRRLV